MTRPPHKPGQDADSAPPLDLEDLRAELKATRQALTDCDAVVQEVADAIVAVCNAAAPRLTFDLHALSDVARLLALVKDQAQSMANAVNGKADENGCCAKGYRQLPGSPDATCARLQAEWQALRAEPTSVAATQGARP